MAKCYKFANFQFKFNKIFSFHDFIIEFIIESCKIAKHLNSLKFLDYILIFYIKILLHINIFLLYFKFKVIFSMNS